MSKNLTMIFEPKNILNISHETEITALIVNTTISFLKTRNHTNKPFVIKWNTRFDYIKDVQTSVFYFISTDNGLLAIDKLPNKA